VKVWPNPVAMQSVAHSMHCSHTVILGSDPTQSMNICLRFSVSLCDSRNHTTFHCFIQEVLQLSLPQHRYGTLLTKVAL